MKNIPQIIIAIDGYSSTGKSSFANMIADELDYIHLDSGALYRAVTLHGIRKGAIGGGEIHEQELIASTEGLDVSLRPRTFIGGEDVEDLIRTMEVSSYVSPVSAIPEIRSFVDGILRKQGEKGGVVLDGRDIGTTVFPNAQLKIFMEADDEVRALRRFTEMKAAGTETTFEDVLANIRDRDLRDSTRAVSPLRKAEDAVVLDNTYMTFEDQMEWLKEILTEKFGFVFE